MVVTPAALREIATAMDKIVNHNYELAASATSGKLTKDAQERLRKKVETKWDVATQDGGSMKSISLEELLQQPNRVNNPIVSITARSSGYPSSGEASADYELRQTSSLLPSARFSIMGPSVLVASVKAEMDEIAHTLMAPYAVYRRWLGVIAIIATTLILVPLLQILGWTYPADSVPQFIRDYAIYIIIVFALSMDLTVHDLLSTHVLPTWECTIGQGQSRSERRATLRTSSAWFALGLVANIVYAVWSGSLGK